MVNKNPSTSLIEVNKDEDLKLDAEDKEMKFDVVENDYIEKSNL